MSGNWEKGDRDGNGFVNQADADWLAGRYAALGVSAARSPGVLRHVREVAVGAVGLNGRWQAARNGGGQLIETGNFTQHNAGLLTFTGTGAGRQQVQQLGRDDSQPEFGRSVRLAQHGGPRRCARRSRRRSIWAPTTETFITFLVRQNTAPLLPAQVALAQSHAVARTAERGGAEPVRLHASSASRPISPSAARPTPPGRTLRRTASRRTRPTCSSARSAATAGSEHAAGVAVRAGIDGRQFHRSQLCRGR